MAIADELRAAAGTVVGLRRLARDLPREARVGGLIFQPLVGAAVGGIAGLAARLASVSGVWPAAVAAVLVLAAASGGATLRGLLGAGPRADPARIGLAAAVLLAKVWAVARLPDGVRMVALALAAMLGRWAMVVQCYGGGPLAGSAQLVGRARLREFGWASTIAFAVTLATLDAVGLVVLLAATLTTVGLRVFAYRRAGGITESDLGASAELVEAVALLVLAGVARR